MKKLALLPVFLALPAFAADKPLQPGRYVVTPCAPAANSANCGPFIPFPLPVTREACESFMPPACAECPAPVVLQPMPLLEHAILSPGDITWVDHHTSPARVVSHQKAGLKTWQKVALITGGVFIAGVIWANNDDDHGGHGNDGPRHGPDCHH